MQRRNPPGELEEVFLQVVMSPDLRTVASDWMDAAAGIPVAKTIVHLWDFAARIREHYFRRKVASFLGPVSSIPHEQRVEQLATLLANEGERERFAAQMLQLLERQDDERKASIAGNLTVRFLQGEIALAELWRMNRAVEPMSLDEEWPVLQVVEAYKETYYKGPRPIEEDWRHEGVLLQEVNTRLKQDYSDGELRSIAVRLNQTGLFGTLGWREGPAHDCELAPWYFTLKQYMHW